METPKTKTEFRRGQHLLFALLSLTVISAAALASWRAVELFGGSWPWDGEDMLLYRTIPLVPVLLLGWLAFVVVDTRAEVKLLEPGWWRIGWEPWAGLAAVFGLHLTAFTFADRSAATEMARDYYSYFHGEFFGVDWPVLIAAILVGVITEEIVFRGLLQRALEGYMRGWYALFAQAVVFHLVHITVYGSSGGGGLHVFTGVLYGLAFMRTRSLLAPIALHATSNLLHAVVFVNAL